MSIALQRLGLPAETRAVIIHADDLGMAYAANAAYEGILEVGVVRSGSVMVPCPWFRHLVTLVESYPQADLGVHITLNSEWNGYRWGPVSTRDPASGLLDGEGYMWRDVPSLHAHMRPDAAIAEMRAQVDMALAAGLDLTHLDTHMGSVAHPALAATYIALAREHGLPAMMPTVTEPGLKAAGVDPGVARELVAEVAHLANRGDFIPLDGLSLPPLDDLGDIPAQYWEVFRRMPAGVTHFVHHPSVPLRDMQAILSPARYRRREWDWRTFSDPELGQHLADAGVTVVEYRHLQAAMRQG